MQIFPWTQRFSLLSSSQLLEAGSCALLYHRREYGCCYDPPSESFTGIEGGREGGREGGKREEWIKGVREEVREEPVAGIGKKGQRKIERRKRRATVSCS